MHIYPWQMDPPGQLIIDPCKTTTSHEFDIQMHAHIPKADGPLGQSIIDPCKTTTPNLFDTKANAHIPMADGLPQSINHRSMQDHYTK